MRGRSGLGWVGWQAVRVARSTTAAPTQTFRGLTLRAFFTGGSTTLRWTFISSAFCVKLQAVAPDRCRDYRSISLRTR